MADSAVPSGPPAEIAQSTPETSNTAQTRQNDKNDRKPKEGKEGTSKPTKQAPGGQPGKDAAISAKALKETKKAEKQARRAKEKESEKQTVTGPPQQAHGKKAEEKKVEAQEQPGMMKEGHKRSGSTTTEAPRVVPVRDASHEAKTVEEAQVEPKQVSLFRHIKGQARITSISAAVSAVHPAVLLLGMKMTNYEICGSNARCIATLLTFRKVIKSYTTPPGHTLTRNLNVHLNHQIGHLVSCRPISVSMGNALRWLKLQVTGVDIDTPESVAKVRLRKAIKNFIKEKITLADKIIASTAAEKIRDGDVVLTFAKSSIVQRSLLEAFKRGKKFRVIVIDSRPLFEGRNLALTLSDARIEVQYSLTHALSYLIKDVTKVFLGAHAMLSNGRLYSRVGTALVAMMAKEMDIPVIVCCESLKFTERVSLDSIVANELANPDDLISSSADTSYSVTIPPPSILQHWRQQPSLSLLNLMYDVTPAEYIKMVITEFGALPPSSVPVVYRISTDKAEQSR